jgi:hypothetical protein
MASSGDLARPISRCDVPEENTPEGVYDAQTLPVFVS